MSDLVTDPTDPRLGHGQDETAVPQNKAYLILSAEERAKGFVQPVRRGYVHRNCGSLTTMSREIAETYARDPWFYGSTYCCSCGRHRPLVEFTWEGGGEMDPRKWSAEQMSAVLAAKEKTSA